MLMLSVDNSIVPEILPRTTKNIQTWDPHSGELPGEEIFEAFVKDLKEAKKNRTHTRVGQRLNYESSGLSSLFRSSGRKIKRIRRAPFKAALIKKDNKIINIINKTENLDKGIEIIGKINWEKRYKYMKMHSALHLMCSVIPLGVTGGQK